MHEGGRRQDNAIDITQRIFQCLFQRIAWLHIVFRHEAAMHMAGPDAHLHHHRRVGCFRQLEGLLDNIHHARQIGARIGQPDLRLHGEGVAALLHDRGAFAIVLADDDDGTTGDTAARQIGQRIAGHIGACRRFPRHRPTDRIHDRGREHGGGGGFGRRGFKVHTKFRHIIGSIGEHIHQMRNRRALIAADIGDTRLQQRLGDGKNAFTPKFIASAKAQIFHFPCKRPFCHGA